MTPALILIVDDDERNRKLARDVLRLDGLATLEAGTGAEALELARAHRPDLVLLDLRLPDGDGTETLRALKLIAPIPVVALTAVGGARAALLEAGFDGYLEKPVDVLALPAEIRRLCGG
jgi:two-component system cell cycle response regulator DivK